MPLRRTFQRQPEAVRHRELIDAALACIAELGLQGATVREVALRAGVTQGLIRHYFLTKEKLIEAAYRHLSAEMTESVETAMGDGPARLRLARFIRASLTPPMVDAGRLSLWAAFVSAVHTSPAVALVHAEGYASYRGHVETLIVALFAEQGHAITPLAARRSSLAINAVIDGLWLELSLSADVFDAIDVVGLAQESAAAILSLSPDALKE
ncbi:MAG: TetR family transcriptional regulator [Phyllobacteriaceae bacterium]|nr:TetR family transcriptional regulator [Phyllobacteriaceae bacterium]